jgi:hypothetical protein
MGGWRSGQKYLALGSGSKITPAMRFILSFGTDEAFHGLPILTGFHAPSWESERKGESREIATK